MKSDLHITSEISAYEELLASINILRDKVQVGREELANSYLGVIDAKKSFEEIKKQNIEEIRTYKYAISVECKEIKSQFDVINKLAGQLSCGELRSFVESCEKLSALDKAGFFTRVKIL